MSIADRFQDELGVTQPGDSRRGNPFRAICRALGAMFGVLGDVLIDTDDGPGWSSLLDADRCPAVALPWLAQFAGVRAQVEAAPDEATKRALITAPPAFQRGTPRGMRAAVALTLTSRDPNQVQVIERLGGDPYVLLVRVRSSDTPDVAVSTTTARRQTPLGVSLTLVTSNTPLLVEYTRPLSAVTATLAAATLADVT